MDIQAGIYANYQKVLDENGKEVWRRTGGGSRADFFSLLTSSSQPFARVPLFLPNKTKITIPADAIIQIGGEIFKSQAAVELDVPMEASARAGKDLYVYAVADADGMSFVVSDNSTVPAGFTAATSRKIGGFHCLCADVGTIDGHALSGYAAGDILPASVWTLEHRPVAEPEGMVYHAGTGKWYDIYLASWNGTKLVSAYNQPIAGGESEKRFHGELFVEEFGKIGKTLLWRDEFQVVAKGSNERTAINGVQVPVTTGGHVDTAGRRMISNLGLEDCCGGFWQWTRNIMDGGAYGTIKKNTDGSDAQQTRFEGYPVAKYTVLQAAVDGEGADYGNCFGYLRRAIVGGCWNDSSKKLSS